MTESPNKKSTAKNQQPNKAQATAQSQAAHRGPLGWIRDWVDPLIVAFLFAMFIRLFVVELFRIPSPSMTPTLLGTERARLTFTDVDRDGDKDMLLLPSYFNGSNAYFYDYFEKRGERYFYEGQISPGVNNSLWAGKAEQRQDQILVNKFAYWFKAPNRGDIAVFKTPRSIFDRTKPIFIKRVVGLPGETLDFEPAPGIPGHLNTMGYLTADGKRVTEPEFFKEQRYEYRVPGVGTIGNLEIPDDGIYAFGDNTVGSKDSRYWGKVPLTHLRGRAILRFYKDFKFLH